MVNLLIPGRHHLLTNFQFNYLDNLIHGGLAHAKDVDGKRIIAPEGIENIIFAVTSADHSNTRRNPFPIEQRAMAIQDFSRDLKPDSTFIYGINDIPVRPDFARYVLETIRHKNKGQFRLTPENTFVVCSTQVMELYEKLGFRILGAELKSRVKDNYELSEVMPWEVIESIAKDKCDWRQNRLFLDHAHHASKRLFRLYNLGDTIRVLFNDKVIGDDGDLTLTRDYRSYVLQMDEIAAMKFKESSPYIRPGRIGDIGCAAGSWIRLASFDERFRDTSDFYGVEIARPLFEICEQRKTQRGEFGTPYIFFDIRNAVSGLVFPENSMNTINTSSLTHEIESYAGRADLLAFISNRYKELASGGVWINRDVVGPEDKGSIVYMRLSQDDGSDNDPGLQFADTHVLRDHLNSLSTFGRFRRFAQDYRSKEGERVIYSIEDIGSEKFVKTTLGTACEFMLKKDYTDNWQSEMHETFCFWSLKDWQTAMEAVGFNVLPESKAFRNEWIVANRLESKIQLFEMHDDRLRQIEYPVTHMLMIGEKH